MSCKCKQDETEMENQIWEIISAAINGEILGIAEEERLLRWMNESPEHRAIYLKLKKHYRAYRNESKIDIDMAYEKYLDGVAKRRRKRQLRVYRYIGYAACIMFVLFAASIGFYRDVLFPSDNIVQNSEIRMGEAKALLTLASGEQVPLYAGKNVRLRETGGLISNEDKVLAYMVGDTLPVAEKIKYNTLEIPRGGEYKLILGDGSAVWLNSDSRLVYPVAFGAEERRVVLEGEGYFEVAKDAKRPFIVVTKKGLDVRVLGTSFNVTAYEDTGEVIATLVEGSVEVGGGACPTEMLKPGKQAVYDWQSGVLDRREVDVRLYTSWKDGYYMFEMERLDDMMNTLARWYNMDVLFEDDALREVRYSGRVKRYGNIQEFLDALKLTHDVDFKIKERTVTVMNKKTGNNSLYSQFVVCLSC